ncbi:MAG: hypothetical protein N2712_00190 [Brevinematales bacterium]|nr:hypothetical protein [Brevinematales bacterium]
MKLGCGKYEYFSFLQNIENPSDEFLKHINECSDCTDSFVETKMAIMKMELSKFEPISNELRYGRILLRLKEGMLEIIDALSGTRYGTRLAFRGETIYQTKKEIVYESNKMKIFVDSYDANELILSTRINNYGEITILDEHHNIIRSTKGKSGVDIRIKKGKYIVKHEDEEIMLEVQMEV